MNSLPLTRGSQRGRGPWLAAVGPLFLAGCLVVPVDYYQTGSRHNVSPKTPSELRLGVTTREELLLSLGEPDFVSDDGQRLGYAWTKVKAVWFVVGYGGAASAEVERSYVLEASFDASSRLSQVRLLKQWGSEVPATRELDPSP
jgi:hypothetical protein